MKKEIDPPVAVGMFGAFVGALTIADVHPFIALTLGGWAAWCFFYYAIKNKF